MKVSKIKSFTFLAALLSADISKANDIFITGGTPVNVSVASDGDAVIFSGNDGTLAIDTNKILASISTTINNSGVINFSTPNTLTMNSDLGSSSLLLKSINFSSDGTLNAKGNIYTSPSGGIRTSADGVGSLVLSGIGTQNIFAYVGSSTLALKDVSIIQGGSTVSFVGDVYAKNFSTSGSGADITVGGPGYLFFNNSNFDQNTIIESTGVNSLGATILADGKTLTSNSTSILDSLAFGTSGNLVIGSTNVVAVTENITGTGEIKGGNIFFIGSIVSGTIAGVVIWKQWESCSKFFDQIEILMMENENINEKEKHLENVVFQEQLETVCPTRSF